MNTVYCLVSFNDIIRRWSLWVDHGCRGAYNVECVTSRDPLVSIVATVLYRVQRLTRGSRADKSDKLLLPYMEIITAFIATLALMFFQIKLHFFFELLIIRVDMCWGFHVAVHCGFIR